MQVLGRAPLSSSCEEQSLREYRDPWSSGSFRREEYMVLLCVLPSGKSSIARPAAPGKLTTGCTHHCDAYSAEHHSIVAAGGVAAPIEGLEDFAGGKVELVEDDPVTGAHGSDKGSLAKDQAAGHVGHVAAQVLLQVRLLVVVDAHAAVPRRLRQVRHQARLAARCGTLRTASKPHHCLFHICHSGYSPTAPGTLYFADARPSYNLAAHHGMCYTCVLQLSASHKTGKTTAQTCNLSFAAKLQPND